MSCEECRGLPHFETWGRCGWSSSPSVHHEVTRSDNAWGGPGSSVVETNFNKLKEGWMPVKILSSFISRSCSFNTGGSCAMLPGYFELLFRIKPMYTLRAGRYRTREMVQ